MDPLPPMEDIELQNLFTHPLTTAAVHSNSHEIPSVSKSASRNFRLFVFRSQQLHFLHTTYYSFHGLHRWRKL
jgi:hypothetical protein